MKALMLIAFAVSSIYAENDRAEGVSPKVFVQDQSGWVSTPREVAIVAPPKKDAQLLLDGFSYHKPQEKPTDILMEGVYGGDVIELGGSGTITFGGN